MAATQSSFSFPLGKRFNAQKSMAIFNVETISDDGTTTTKTLLQQTKQTRLMAYV